MPWNENYLTIYSSSWVTQEYRPTVWLSLFKWTEKNNSSFWFHTMQVDVTLRVDTKTISKLLIHFRRYWFINWDHMDYRHVCFAWFLLCQLWRTLALALYGCTHRHSKILKISIFVHMKKVIYSTSGITWSSPKQILILSIPLKEQFTEKCECPV